MTIDEALFALSDRARNALLACREHRIQVQRHERYWHLTARGIDIRIVDLALLRANDLQAVR